TRAKRDWRADVCSSDLSLMLDSRRAEACSTDFEKVRRYVKRLCARLLPRRGGVGSEQIRLLSAITPQGPVFYSGTIRALADRAEIGRASCREGARAGGG